MYAVGRTYEGGNPGFFSDEEYTTDSFDIDVPLSQIAEIVKEDLLTAEFSYPCVDTTSTRPLSLPSGKLALAVRLGEHIAYPLPDYHFMRTTNGTVWYHKPGKTNPLKYNYLPSESVNWTSEYSSNGSAHPGNYTYSGDIYYIIASSYHATGATTVYSGNQYHSGNKHYFEYVTTCSECTEARVWRSVACSGPPCAIYPSSLEDEHVTE